ncbi:amidohydrolase [uncultured Bifidobacterium sp.]|uniref:amidohydrolase n=1 Tax=uncultured Bifidobacterium sp. TaxID=165187 RepID=UPI0028DB3CA6|nr:amidohydrolase [uncultured Bifidobacterium sp.]
MPCLRDPSDSASTSLPPDGDGHALRLKGVRLLGSDADADVDIVDGTIAAITMGGSARTPGSAASADGPTRPSRTASRRTRATPGEVEAIDADGLWAIPGLWDCHTHFTQWAQTFGRLDLLRARSADEAMGMLRKHIAGLSSRAGGLDPRRIVVGMRFRHSLWTDDQQPSLSAIDDASGGQPVALSSADMHCGWVNSAAASLLNVHVGSSGLVGELEWFDAYHRLDSFPGAADEELSLVRRAEADAASKGVVGIRDYEMAEPIASWIGRFSAGADVLRVEAGVYPERLQAAIDAGWHTGDKLPGSRGLGHVGAMKLIADGSLNTRSAYCYAPYSGIETPTCGVLSYTPAQIEDYFRLATDNGFAIACHAIGDRANAIVLDAVERTRAHGSIEHAQLLRGRDIPRFARLELDVSVQPQHAMDDRDVISRFWATQTSLPYPFRSLHDAGARLRFGSDAPVAPLDPWLAMSAAVFETDSSDRRPFQAGQRLDAPTALRASTATGRDAPQVGDPADLVLMDSNPYDACSPEEMRGLASTIRATMLAGRWTYHRS